MATPTTSQIDLSRRLETGRATGTIELYTETVDECDGDLRRRRRSPRLGSHRASPSPASDRSRRSRGHGTYKIPSEFNGHQSSRGTERAGERVRRRAGSIDATFGYAYMSQVSWSEHTNS